MIIEEIAWPSNPREMLKEAPRATKLILLKSTVNTPTAPALYHKIGIPFWIFNFDLVANNTVIIVIKPIMWMSTLEE